MPKVFVSYAHPDRKRVALLVAKLRDAGIDAWWDDDISPDAPWETTIEQSLKSADTVVVCWSPASLASENVKSEARWAKGSGNLVQIFLEPCDPPLFFGERQGVDLTGWRGNAANPRFVRLVGTLAQPKGDVLPAAATATHRPWRLATVGVASLLLAVIAGLGIWLLTPRAGASGVRVRVDRLQVGSGDAAAQQLRQSLATDLTRAIVGNDATLDFQDDSGAAGAGGKADYSITGEAQSAGTGLHAAVRLLDTANGTILWSREFSGDGKDVGALRSMMAQRIADVLICAFGSRSRRPADIDIATLKLFLAGCENYHTDWPAARRYFTDVVARRPDFAQARGMLSTALFWSTGTFSGVPRADWDKIRDQSYAEAVAALAKDKNIGAAYFVLAHRLGRPDQINQKLDLLRRGKQNDPDSGEIALQLCDTLTNIGLMRRGLAECERAASLDPFSRLNAANLAETYGFMGRLAEADDTLTAARAEWPSEFYSSWIRFDVAARKRAPAIALAMLDNPANNPGYQPLAAAQWRLFLLARTDPSKVASVASAIIAGAPALNSQGRMEAVIDLVQLGRADDAIHLALSLPPWSSAWNGRWFYDVLAPLRADPRFQQIAQRQGLVDMWRRLDGMPDFCAESGLQWKCPASPKAWR